MENLLELLGDNKMMIVIALVVVSFFPQAKNGLVWVWDWIKKFRGGDDSQVLFGEGDKELSDFQALK